MAAINGKKLKRLLQNLTKQLGHTPTFYEVREAMNGRKVKK